MIIPKKQAFSARIQQIEDDQNENYQRMIQHEKDKQKRKVLKQKYAARIIRRLVRQEPPRDVTTFSWGDVASRGLSYMGPPMQRLWDLAPTDVKHYMILCEGEAWKVKGILRGHEHEHEHFRHYKNADKVFMTTLTVGMDSNSLDQEIKQDDRAYILTTAPKVKDWLKQGILRAAKSWDTRVTKPFLFSSSEV